MAHATVLAGLLVASSMALPTFVGEAGFYSSEDHELVYFYEMEPAESGLRALRVETSLGWLDLEVVRGPDGLEIHTAVMDEEQVLTIGERDVTLQSPSGPASCDPIRAQAEALGLMAAESFSLEAPPDHLATAYATLHLSTRLSMVEADCGEIELPGPDAGACSAWTTDHADCTSCCERDARIAKVGCRLYGNSICKMPGCKYLVSTACGKATESLEEGCLEQNCAGKPGDPACVEPLPPCPYSCQFRCGLTQKGSCGDCSHLNPDFVCCGG